MTAAASASAAAATTSSGGNPPSPAPKEEACLSKGKSVSGRPVAAAAQPEPSGCIKWALSALADARKRAKEIELWARCRGERERCSVARDLLYTSPAKFVLHLLDLSEDLVNLNDCLFNVLCNQLRELQPELLTADQSDNASVIFPVKETKYILDSEAEWIDRLIEREAVRRVHGRGLTWDLARDSLAMTRFFRLFSRKMAIIASYARGIRFMKFDQYDFSSRDLLCHEAQIRTLRFYSRQLYSRVTEAYRFSAFIVQRCSEKEPYGAWYDKKTPGEQYEEPGFVSRRILPDTKQCFVKEDFSLQVEIMRASFMHVAESVRSGVADRPTTPASGSLVEASVETTPKDPHAASTRLDHISLSGFMADILKTSNDEKPSPEFVSYQPSPSVVTGDPDVTSSQSGTRVRVIIDGSECDLVITDKPIDLAPKSITPKKTSPSTTV